MFFPGITVSSAPGSSLLIPQTPYMGLLRFSKKLAGKVQSRFRRAAFSFGTGFCSMRPSPHKSYSFRSSAQTGRFVILHRKSSQVILPACLAVSLAGGGRFLPGGRIRKVRGQVVHCICAGQSSSAVRHVAPFVLSPGFVNEANGAPCLRDALS